MNNNNSIKFNNLKENGVKEYRYTENELKDFTRRLNFDIQYLGLNKDELIKIVNGLYK